MYLICSDWSIRCLDEEEEEKENCHLLTTTRRTDKGRGKKDFSFRPYLAFKIIIMKIEVTNFCDTLVMR